MTAIAGKMQGRDHKGRFKPGHSGNPKGKKLGTRNKATIAVQSLLDGEAEVITRKAVDLALEGDTTALRLCLERLLPPKKDAPVKLELPPISGPHDAVKALSILLESVGNGELSPSEGQAVTGLLKSYMQAVEVEELERRIVALEKGSSK